MESYNKKIGNFWEKIARDYLLDKGYKILGGNIQLGHKELDIVASCGDVLVFFEVKTRTSERFGSADGAMSVRKTGEIKQAISRFLVRAERAGFLGKFGDIRLDFISVDIDKVCKTAKVKHYKDVG